MESDNMGIIIFYIYVIFFKCTNFLVHDFDITDTNSISELVVREIPTIKQTNKNSEVVNI